MASGQIRMTPDKMRTASKKANGYADKLQDVRTGLETLLQTLEKEWEGKAIEGYKIRYNKIKPVLKNAQELVMEIRDNLKTTASILEDTDQKIKGEFEKNSN